LSDLRPESCNGIVVELNDVIDFLFDEGDLDRREIVQNNPEPTGHGNCCTCTKCGYFHDDCVCANNYLIKQILNMVNKDE
jgi:hypothetical protein